MSSFSFDESEVLPPSSPPLSPVPIGFSDDITWLDRSGNNVIQATETCKRDAAAAELSDDSDIEIREVKRARVGRQSAAIHLYFTEPEGKDQLRWCKACEALREKNPKLSTSIGRFGSKSGNSTLRKHLRSFHKHLWKKHQAQEGSESELTPASSQTTLDVHLQPSERYTPARLQQTCLQLIAALDLPFTTLDRPEFKELVQVLRPDAALNDLPGRKGLADLALRELSDEKARIRARLHSTKGRKSITVDAWSDSSMRSYICAKAHYIVLSENKWSLEQDLIGFRILQGSHTGENLANVVFGFFAEMDIIQEIGWITTDNASNNDTMLLSLERLMCKSGVRQQDFDRESNHIRCMAHIYNLAVVDMLKILVRKPAYENEATAAEAQLSAEDLRDPVISLRGLIVALRSSSSRREAFQTAQALRRNLHHGPTGQLIGGLELILDVRTRWSSTYAMLTRALELRSSLDAVLLMPEHEAKLSRFRIPAAGWTRIKQIADLLRIAHKGQQLLSADSHPTLYMAIPALESPMGAWEKLQTNQYANDPVMHKVLDAGLKKMGDYYLKMEKSDAYAIAMILTPYVKTKYLEKWWSSKSKTDPTKTLAQQATAAFISTFKHSYQTTPSNAAQAPVSEDAELWGDIWDTTIATPPEFLRYLKEEPTLRPSAGGQDSLAYWYSHRATYPDLSRMAMDYLAIQGSATAVERVWSSAANTDTRNRNRLTPVRFEALQFLKAGYRKVRKAGLTREERKAQTVARLKDIEAVMWQEDIDDDVELLLSDMYTL